MIKHSDILIVSILSVYTICDTGQCYMNVRHVGTQPVTSAR